MAQSFWPGKSFRSRTDFRTGRADVFREISDLSEAGVKMYVQQAQDQLSTSQIEISKAEADYSIALGKERDESRYPAMLKKFEASVNKFRPKNPLGAKHFDTYVAGKSVEWGKSTTGAQQDRLIDKWQIKADELEKGYIETGDEAAYVTHMLSGPAIHGLDESQVMKRIEKARHDAERRKAENAALSDPEGFLKKVRGNKIKGFPLLTPGDIQDIRNTARGEISFRKSQEDAALSSFYTDVSKKAEEGMAYGELRDLIRNQPGLAVEEREKAMNVARSAYRTWDDGGTKENPWKTTQDYNALMEMQIKISRGEPVTEMDIIRAQMARPDKGPLFSNTDRNNLFSQLPDNKDPSMRTPVSKQWLADVDDMFMDNKGLVPKEDREGWMKTLNGVTEIIRINHPDVGKTQKEIDAFLKPAKKKKIRALLSNLLLAGINVGGTILNPNIIPQRIIATLGKPKPPVHIDTLEEAEKLKQGTSFEYQGRIYKRK